MKGFDGLLKQLNEEGRSKLALPSKFNPIVEHSLNKKNKNPIKVLHASLEYGMPNKPGNIAVGGVGSFLSSFTIAQLAQPDTDARVIMPYYPQLQTKPAKQVAEVIHWFKGTSVKSIVYVTKTDSGVIQYLVEADLKFYSLFWDITRAATIYSNAGDNSKFLDRVSYFCGAVAAFGMVGENKFLPHVIQGHSWGLCFIGKLIAEYRILYSDGVECCSPQTLFTTHSAHNGDGSYDFSEVPDIGITRTSKTISFTQEITDSYDHLVYVSEQLLKESITNPSSFSKNVWNRYLDGGTSAIMNNVFGDQFDPALCLPKEHAFDLTKIADGKRKLKQHINATMLKNTNKNILLDMPATLYLGRYSPEKGIDKLDLAISVTIKNGGTFICMGVGDYDGIVNNLIKKYQDNPHVIILTTSEQQAQYGVMLRCLSDIYFVPSKMEACGLVPMEGNIAGAMVVAAQVGGLINVIRKDANGMLFSGDAELMKMLSAAQQTWLELRDAGNLNIALQLIQSSARKTFDWHAPKVGAVKAYFDLYRSLGDKSALELRLSSSQTELTAAIIKHDDAAFATLLQQDIDVNLPNNIGLNAKDIAMACNRFDLVAKLDEYVKNKPILTRRKHSAAKKNLVVLNMCYEYKQVKLGGVGETVTALTESINRKKEELATEARVVTPHYPWHDDLIANGVLKDAVELFTVDHYYCDQRVVSTVTAVNNDGAIQYLIRLRAGEKVNDLFAAVTFNQQSKIYDDITPKLAYFNSAVAAFVTSDHPNAPVIDVLNGHSWGCGLASRLIKEYYKREFPKCVLTVHSELSEQGIVPANHEHMEHLHGMGLLFTPNVPLSPLVEGMKGSDHVIYVSQELEKQAHRHGGPYSVKPFCEHYSSLGRSSPIINNISNVFNPVNLGLDLSNIISAKYQAKQKINELLAVETAPCLQGKHLGHNKLLTVFVGRFLHEKGIDNLEAAIDETLMQGGSFIVMGLYGGGKEDELIKSLDNKYKNNPDVIIMHEQAYVLQRKYGPLIRFAADAGFIPSHRESCGLVSMEVQLNGAFVISSDVGGLNDTVKEYVTGVMYKNGTEGVINGRRNTDEVKDAIRKAHNFLHQLKADPANHNQRLQDLYSFSLKNYIWEGENGSLVKYINLFSRLVFGDVNFNKNQLPSFWDLPKSVLSKINLRAGDLRAGLPLDFVRQAHNKDTIFELPGYPHYLMRTSKNDIIGIFANGKHGEEKAKIDLGKGALGVVYLGQILHSHNNNQLVGTFVAVKSQNLDVNSVYAATALKNEKNILAKQGYLVLPYIETDSKYSNLKYMFMDLFKGKNLQECIVQNELSIIEKVLVAAKAAAEIANLHAKNVIHLDVHTGNILVEDISTEEARNYKVTLIDYGVAKNISDSEEFIDVSTYMDFCPAEVSQLKAGKKTDVYLLGITLAKMFLSDFFKDSEELEKYKAVGNLVVDRVACAVANFAIFESYSAKDRRLLQDLKSIICKMLHQNYAKRVSAAEAVKLLQDLYSDYLSPNEPSLIDIDSQIYNSSLQDAFVHGYINIIKSMVDAGADLNVIDRNSLPPQMKKLFDVCVFVRAHGLFMCNLNAWNLQGYTPLTALYKFSEKYDQEQRKYLSNSLVRYGADINLKNKYGFVPLSFATTETDVLQLAYLGADIQSSAINSINIDIYKFYRKNNFRTLNSDCIDEVTGHFPLSRAVQDNNFTIVKEILRNHPEYINNVGLFGNTALHIAVEQKNELMIKYLLEQKNAKLYLKNLDAQRPLELTAGRHSLSLNTHLATLATLMDHELKAVDAMNNALRSMNYNRVYALALKYPDAVVACNTDSIIINDLDALSLLVDLGFNIHDYSNSLLKVLSFLRKHNYSLSVSTINQWSIDGHTPLTIAANLQELDMCEELINFGADVNAPNSLGNTALHAAVDTGNTQLVELLLALGADNNITNDNGYKPSQIAFEHNNKALVDLLEGNHKPKSSYKKKYRM